MAIALKMQPARVLQRQPVSYHANLGYFFRKNSKDFIQ
ncbi:hypothetical protein ABIB30_002131 [Pedobacter sp. UYP1]|jgi:hypothetical protein